MRRAGQKLPDAPWPLTSQPHGPWPGMGGGCPLAFIWRGGGTAERAHRLVGSAARTRVTRATAHGGGRGWTRGGEGSALSTGLSTGQQGEERWGRVVLRREECGGTGVERRGGRGRGWRLLGHGRLLAALGEAVMGILFEERGASALVAAGRAGRSPRRFVCPPPSPCLLPPNRHTPAGSAALTVGGHRRRGAGGAAAGGARGPAPGGSAQPHPP